MPNLLPKISIVTPSYNQGDFIEATILSVLNQTYKNIEYIIVDGGSTDHTMDVVNKYRTKIDIVIHEKDKGQSDAINKGFKLATGELAGWINSDDVLYEDCIEEIVNLYLNNKNAAIYYGSYLSHIDVAGKKNKELCTIINSPEDILNNNYRINQPGSFYKLSYLKKVNYVDEKINYSMDLDLWLKLLKHGSIVHFDKHSISALRIWGDTKTSTGGIKFYNEIYHTLKRHHAKPFNKNFRRLKWYSLKWRIKSSLKMA